MMSPWSLHVFMQKCLRNACSDVGNILARNMNIYLLLYADDEMLFTKNLNDLQQIYIEYTME